MNSKQPNECREAFEKWATQESNRYDITPNMGTAPETYFDYVTEDLWTGWQAAYNHAPTTIKCKELEVVRELLNQIATGKDKHGYTVDFYSDIAKEALSAMTHNNVKDDSGLTFDSICKRLSEAKDLVTINTFQYALDEAKNRLQSTDKGEL